MKRGANGTAVLEGAGGKSPARVVRCAIYTRKSTDEGLTQDFNSLDAQRESAKAFVQSQRHEGWEALPERYDDGGYSGANTDRPAFQRLLGDVEAGRVDAVAVYKIDRLTRSHSFRSRNDPLRMWTLGQAFLRSAVRATGSAPAPAPSARRPPPAESSRGPPRSALECPPAPPGDARKPGAPRSDPRWNPCSPPPRWPPTGRCGSPSRP